MIAPRGSLLGSGSIFPWTNPHPEDVAELERQRAERKAKWENVTHRPKVNGVTARAMKALRDECDGLARTTTGYRSDHLNRAAFNLGQLVGMGELPEELVVEGLTAASHANNHITDDGERAIHRSIASGLESGKAAPRER
ncbi:hypothetical protein [Mycobacterium syngnathidarum]